MLKQEIKPPSKSTNQLFSKSEIRRARLVDRCLDAMGDATPEFAEVISYFPKAARVFIQKLNYAYKVMKKRELWFIVTLPGGQNEHLWSMVDFPVECLVRFIRLIQEFRSSADTNFLSVTPDKVQHFLWCVSGRSTSPIMRRMVRKLMIVMRVDDDDVIPLMKYYIRTRKEAGKLFAKSSALQQEALRALAGFNQHRNQYRLATPERRI